MVDLADGKRLVAVLAEPAAKRHQFRVVEERIGVGMGVVAAEHEGRSAWRADDSLAVGMGEDHTRRGEAIQIWGNRGRVAVAAEPSGEIIGHEKQNIGPGGAAGLGGGRCCPQQHKGRRDQNVSHDYKAPWVRPFHRSLMLPPQPSRSRRKIVYATADPISGRGKELTHFCQATRIHRSRWRSTRW